MAAKLTHGQYWTLHKLSQLCLVYEAITLRYLINQYLKQHCNNALAGRKDHERMLGYFKELFDLTVNNQLSK